MFEKAFQKIGSTISLLTQDIEMLKEYTGSFNNSVVKGKDEGLLI